MPSWIIQSRQDCIYWFNRCWQSNCASDCSNKKKATLELGGKGANIVFDDAPIDETVEGIVNGIFFNQGHVCCAGSRLLLQENIAEEVLAKLKVRMAKIRVGDPLDKNTDLGAINSATQLGKIRELATSGDSEGAQRWSPACSLPRTGSGLPPQSLPALRKPSHRARGNLRPRSLCPYLPYTGRSHREGQ